MKDQPTAENLQTSFPGRPRAESSGFGDGALEGEQCHKRQEQQEEKTCPKNRRNCCFLGDKTKSGSTHEICIWFPEAKKS